MQILFAISVFCFVGILWAAIAMARRIKAGILRDTLHATAPHDSKVHVVAASSPSFGDISRSIALAQATPLQSSPAQFIPPRSVPAQSVPNPQDRKARQATLQQSVHDITANKQWTLPLQSVHMQRLPIQRVESKKKSTTPARKPPQPALRGPMERLDPAYYNKDLGDLTDPYQPPARLRVNDRNHPSANRGY